MKSLTPVTETAILFGTTEAIGSTVTTVKRGFFVACNFVGESRRFLRIGALMTCRDKAGNGANKAGGIASVVESMRHLSSGALSKLSTME